MGEDKRVHRRVIVNEEFGVIDGLMSEYVANISHGGIFLRCDAVLPIGTRVQLKFTVLLDDIETIEGIGEVAHHTAEGEAGLGIKFVELTDRSRQHIDELLSRNLE